MYLWHAIKSGCLDREITPCLPTNKPPALVSSPLFIIHNLPWCQGQSDCIVMVKGKSGDPELSTRIENPGTRQTKSWSVTAWIVINHLQEMWRSWKKWHSPANDSSTENLKQKQKKKKEKQTWHNNCDFSLVLRTATKLNYQTNI